jgi:hypothetical protein
LRDMESPRPAIEFERTVRHILELGLPI